ncbi:MAG: hypothetical protein AAFX08_08395 [Pseudomonadota bacterium]
MNDGRRGALADRWDADKWDIPRVARKAMVCAALAPAIAAAFLAIITVAASLPDAPITANILERKEVLLSRRADNGRVIDADTECIALSVGMADAQRDGALRQAVRARSAYGCAPFMNWLETGAAYEPRDYFRYWHGHLALTRPLLSILPYNDIRGILFTASLALFGWFLWRLGVDFGARASLAFALPFLVLNALGYWVVASKAVTWFLAIGASIFLSRRGGLGVPHIAYFLIGALTAFFDFLTAPALIFCLPTIVWLMYARAEQGFEQSPFAKWRNVFWMGCFFVAGYAGLWAAKLAIAAVLLETPVWADAIGRAGMRLRGESDLVDAYWPGLALYKNIAALKSLWAPVAIGLFFVAPFATASGRAAAGRLLSGARLPLAVAIAPLVFMEILSNHSQIHAAFTHLNFAPLFIVCGLILLGESDALIAGEAQT